MTKREQVNRVVDKAIQNLKNKSLKAATVEKVINWILDAFEKETGYKVKNKPFKIKYEKVK